MTAYNLIYSRGHATQMQKPNPTVDDLKAFVAEAQDKGGFVTIWTTFMGTAYPIPLKGFKLANMRSSDSDSVVQQLNTYFGQDIISI